jgi:hypothetical protein
MITNNKIKKGQVVQPEISDVTNLQTTLNAKANLSGGNTFSEVQKIDSITKVNGSGNYAVEDGTVLYHTAKWFTPTGTFSSNGTTVTTTGSQLTSAMVGAKIGVGADKRIITAFINSNSVTVESAFSQNYVSEVSGNWGVYSRDSAMLGNFRYFFGVTGDVFLREAAGNTIQSGNGFQNAGGGWFADNFSLISNYRFLWSDSTTNAYSTRDTGFRRSKAGEAEINNGTNGVLRDIKVRSTIVSDNTAVADATNVGATRYRVSGNNSFMEMSMQTGASTYAWVEIVKHSW